MALIAEQNFNGISGANAFTSDELTTGQALTNGGANHTSTGPTDLGFTSIWNATRSNETGPISGETSGDFIGVNNFTGSGAPNVAADGTAVAEGVETNFEFNDTDGEVALTFDAVDLTGHSDIALTLDYWIADTGYESDDAFTVSITDGTVTVALLSLGEPELEAQVSADDGSANWQSFGLNIDSIITDNGMDATQIQLVVAADTNSGSENIFVDNIKFESDTIVGGGDGTVIASTLTGDADVNLTASAIDSTDGWALGDGFAIMQRGVTENIPFSLADDSAGSFEPDTLGIIDTGDTSPFFGITDTVNSANSGSMTASWTFDISAASNPYVSIDLAAMGDFEASDTLTFSGSVDGGDAIDVLTVVIDEDGSKTYTMEGGAIVTLNDPAEVGTTNVELTNDFQTFFKELGQSGNELVLTVTSSTDGGSEAFAFQNLIITDGAPAEGFDVDEIYDDVGEPEPEPEITTLAADDEHLLAAAYNIAGVENFSTGELANNAAEVAGHIVTNMATPDIVALQEVSNANTVAQLDAILAEVNALGGPEYAYVFEEITQAGAGGVTAINNAILYRTDRVDYVEGSAELLTDVDYGSSFPRFPLKADFTFNGETITVIDVHLKSGSKGSDPDTNDDAADRLVQGNQLNVILDELRDADNDANIIVLGDFNDIDATEPMIQLADDEVFNIVDEAAPGDDSTATFGAVIDHIMLSDAMNASAQVDYVHVNADYGQSASDHDPVVARILFRTEEVEDFSAVTYAGTREEAAATSVSLENAGHLADYFDTSEIWLREVVVLQDGSDDFTVQVETSDGWTAFDFENVGSMDGDSTANLIEFLESFEASGLETWKMTVGINGGLSGGEEGAYSFLDLTYTNEWWGFFNNTWTSGGWKTDLAGHDDIIIGDNNRDQYGEVFWTGRGDDFLFGGNGEDIMNGGKGSDTYYYRKGDGDDVIRDRGRDSDGTDTLQFGDDISLADLTLAEDPENAGAWILTIDDGSTDGATITLDSNRDEYGGIDQILLADGTLLSQDNGFGLI